jgi:Protein of unknown function (DUF3631)
MSTTITRGRPPAALAGYSDEELCGFYNASTDEAWQAALTAEMDRRDEEARTPAVFRRTGPARPDPVRAEWHDAAHAQYLAAENELRGELVRKGSHVTDGWQLWRGSERFALANASEELRNWWLVNPRVTVTAYRDQVRAQREAYRYDALDSDGPGPVRHDRAAGADGAVPGAGPVRDTGHVRPDRSGAVRGEAMDDMTVSPSRAGQELRGRANAIRDEQARRAAGQPLAGEQDQARVIAPAEAYGRSQGAVALRGAGAVTSRDARAAEIIAESLRYAERVLTRHVSWPSPHALDTVLLWCLHANARDRDSESGTGPLIWRASPRLMLTSKVRGSGKSTGLDLIGILVGSRAGRLTRVTAPGFAKLMAKFQEAGILDEAKMIFGNGQKSLDLQGMLLTGYTKRANSLTAHNGGQLESVFGAVAYAGKDNLITTASDGIQDLLDRSMIIRMRRPSHHYPDIDEVAEQAAELAYQGMATWTTMKRRELLDAVARLNREDAMAGQLSAAEVDGGILRAKQLWRPLLAIADVIGGDMPERAREAATASGAETEEWLEDLRSLEADLFRDAQADPYAELYEDDEED